MGGGGRRCRERSVSHRQRDEKVSVVSRRPLVVSSKKLPGHEGSSFDSNIGLNRGHADRGSWLPSRSG